MYSFLVFCFMVPSICTASTSSLLDVFEQIPSVADHENDTISTQKNSIGMDLTATQTPDNVIQLVSSRLHYRFNLKWLVKDTHYKQ